MEDVVKLIDLLPKYEEIKSICVKELEADYILQLTTNHIKSVQENGEELKTGATEEVAYLLQSLVDKFWERIHTGHFSEVPLHIRQIYAVAVYFKIFYNLFESLELTQVEKCSEILDDAILIGCTQNLYARSSLLQKKLIQLFDDRLLAKTVDAVLPIIAPLEPRLYRCDVPQRDCPSVEIFRQHFFDSKQPVLMRNTIKHWPALHKWRDLNYILQVAGNRRVPIEIGSNYTTDDWSQQLVKIRDFLQRQFVRQDKMSSDQTIEYLAQHELFDQVPALKADICVPDYCSLGLQIEPIDIKAWLGPCGTISPLHYDPKNNLLCQVFGAKKILLAASDSTQNLYPHDTDFLSNTSQIDAENLDLQKFPLLEHVKFYELTLQAGDCLYIPPKWWHYVRALSESFSVSFWWE